MHHLARSSAAALAALAAACSSAPYAGDIEPEGDATVVELLDADFVRAAGKRVPWEELVWSMRTQVRAARAAGTPAPWVELRVATDLELPSSVVDRLHAGLREAGVRHIAMTLAP